MIGRVLGKTGRGVDDRIPPDRGLDDFDRKLGLPLNPPDFMKRPLARSLSLHHSPADSQYVEPMQQPAAIQVVGLAQVQIDNLVARLRREAQALLLARQVLP